MLRKGFRIDPLLENPDESSDHTEIINKNEL